MLELGVFLSIKQGDEAAFERNYVQLRVYYGDARGLLPPSDQEATVTALNLLRLLVQNRIAEFHTELEVVPAEVQAAPEVAQVRGATPVVHGGEACAHVCAACVRARMLAYVWGGRAGGCRGLHHGMGAGAGGPEVAVGVSVAWELGPCCLMGKPSRHAWAGAAQPSVCGAPVGPDCAHSQR